jgi:hypothetical protein
MATISTIWSKENGEVGFIDSEPELGLRAWLYDDEGDDPFDRAAIADYQSLIERIQALGYTVCDTEIQEIGTKQIGTVWTKEGDEIGRIYNDEVGYMKAYIYSSDGLVQRVVRLDYNKDSPKEAIACYGKLVNEVLELGYLVGSEFGDLSPKNEKFIDYTNTGDVAR